MRLENHVERLKEHVSALEWGIERGNQSAVGFHTSAGAVELLSIMLHRLKLVPMDFQLNHAWFKSESMIGLKLDFDFPRKSEIISIMRDMEDIRNPLCYGSNRPGASDKMAKMFYRLKKVVESVLGEALEP